MEGDAGPGRARLVPGYGSGVPLSAGKTPAGELCFGLSFQFSQGHHLSKSLLPPGKDSSVKACLCFSKP